MKLKYIAFSALLAVVAAGTTSCEDFLSKNPDNRVELNTPEQMQMLLVNGYTYGNIALMCELSSDNIVDNNAPNSLGQRYNLPEYGRIDNEIFAWEAAESDNAQDSPTMLWEGCYHAIACANHVLERVAEFEAEGRGDEVSAVKGEALLIRAYHHFLLANLFCMPYRGPELSKSLQGIPYATEPETTLSVIYDRGNLADVYDKIEADLLEGLPLIDDASYEQPKYHFNSAAANAFAARFYLYKRDYVKAEEYANVALGGSGAPAISQLTDWWSQSFTSSTQSVQYWISVERQNNLLIMPTQSVFLRHISGGSRYAYNGEGGDATYMSAGPSWTAAGGFHPCWLGKLYINGEQDYGAFGGNLLEMFEYTDRIAGIGFPHIVRVEFTNEEVLFTRAEARIYLGKIDEAVADLKVWDDSRKNGLASSYDSEFTDLSRSNIISFYGTSDPGHGIAKELHIDEVCPSDKYSVTDENEPFLQCALHFRRVHNVGDGTRWFDIKRYGLEYSHTIGASRVETLTMLDPRKAFQLPAEVLSAGMAPTDRSTPVGESDAIFVPVQRNVATVK